MGLREFVILLNSQNTYYSGQTLRGLTEISVDTPKKVRGVCVKIQGVGHTEWSKTGKEVTSTEKTSNIYMGHEEYFQSTYYLAGSGSGNNQIELSPGKHVYKFDCPLPPTLPSSFEGPFGYVRYTVKIILDRPWKFDHEKKMAFTVVNVLDLNLFPSYKEPILIQMERTFSCLCCTSASVTVEIRTPVSGYAPGQLIPIRIYVENLTEITLELLKIYIKRLTIYRATSSPDAIKKVEDVMLCEEDGPIGRSTCRIYDVYKPLPPTPPSYLANCNIIDVSYEFCVECHMAGCHANFSDKKFIAVGTVPLLGMLAQSVPPGVDPNFVSEDPNGMPFEYPPYQKLYPTLTEPVYQKCLYASRDLKERGESEYVMIQGRENFAPTYPTYAAIEAPPFLQ